jgi:hypothetical protein
MLAPLNEGYYMTSAAGAAAVAVMSVNTLLSENDAQEKWSHEYDESENQQA